MNAISKISKAMAITLLAATSMQALAETAHVTRESVEKTALIAHPGKVEMVTEAQRMGKDVWKVQIKGTDGKEYALYYDTKTGVEIK